MERPPARGGGRASVQGVPRRAPSSCASGNCAAGLRGGWGPWECESGYGKEVRRGATCGRRGCDG